MNAQDRGGELASALAERTARARPVLASLAALADEQDAVVVAVDGGGFPVAQRRLPSPVELPGAVVVGRHNRCDVAAPEDSRVSLRHLLLTARAPAGATGRGMRFRGYDLGGRSGLVLADGQQVAGASFVGQGIVVLGRTVVYVFSGGERSAGALSGTDEEVFAHLTGLAPSGTGVPTAVSATSEPGPAYLEPREPQEFGYRGVDPSERAVPRGTLALRSTKDREGGDRRELAVDSRQLGRGLLIGRYSDRCSLAGHGRNLSRVHALVTDKAADSLLVYDLASTNGVRPHGRTEGASHPVVRLTPAAPVMLGHFELSWIPHGG